MTAKRLLGAQLLTVIVHALMVALWFIYPVLIFELIASCLAVLEPALTASLLFVLSRQSEGFKNAWRIGGFSYLFFTVGVAIVSVLFLWRETVSPTLADLILGVATGFFVLMTLKLPRPDTPRLRGFRLFVDVTVSSLIFIIYIWRFLFAPPTCGAEHSTAYDGCTNFLSVS